MEDDLRQVEKSILEGEESYLEDTNHYGNVVKGWDGFLTSRPKPHGASHHASKRVNVALRDRIWSLSSQTAPIQDSFEEDGNEPDSTTFGGNFKAEGQRRNQRTMAKEGDVSD